MVAVPLGPAQVDISGVRAGDLNEFTITITSGGTPVVLDDYTITASARVKQTDVESLDAECVKADDDGTVIIRWPGEDVRTWLGDKIKLSGVWDLQMANGTDPVTVAAGTFAAEMDVTR